MVVYLSEEDITEINRYSLELTNEGDKHHVMQSDDVRFIIHFVEERFKNDIYKKALAYCISIIVLHPFQNGNHRTSLISAEQFLKRNKYKLLASDKERIQLEQWRLKYEEEHELDREFFRITNLEKEIERKNEIEKIMKNPYAIKIDNWLKKYAII